MNHFIDWFKNYGKVNNSNRIAASSFISDGKIQIEEFMSNKKENFLLLNKYAFGCFVMWFLFSSHHLWEMAFHVDIEVHLNESNFPSTTTNTVDRCWKRWLSLNIISLCYYLCILFLELVRRVSLSLPFTHAFLSDLMVSHKVSLSHRKRILNFQLLRTITLHIERWFWFIYFVLNMNQYLHNVDLVG